jgi:hypothetical protein
VTLGERRDGRLAEQAVDAREVAKGRHRSIRVPGGEQIVRARVRANNNAKRYFEARPRVLAYVKNHFGSETRRYRPDCIVLVDDGRGPDDPLHLVVEIKGYRREDAKEKKSTVETYWVPACTTSAPTAAGRLPS